MKKDLHIIIDGHHLTLEEFINVTRHLCKVSIADDAVQRIIRSRTVVDSFVEEGKVVYGVTTGFGNFSEW